MMINIAEQQAGFTAVNNQANIAARPHRPEVLVPGAIQLVETHAGAGRIQLQVEGRCFDELLLVAG